jgi:hypothetical protein
MIPRRLLCLIEEDFIEGLKCRRVDLDSYISPIRQDSINVEVKSLSSIGTVFVIRTNVGATRHSRRKRLLRAGELFIYLGRISRIHLKSFNMSTHPSSHPLKRSIILASACNPQYRDIHEYEMLPSED